MQLLDALRLRERSLDLGPDQSWKTLLVSPYRDYSIAELCRHFHVRKAVQYFAVCEAEYNDRTLTDAVLAHRFTFNGETHQLNAEIDWLNNPSDDIEWQILLHKCYYLVGLGKAYSETGEKRYAEEWMALTRSWTATVDAGFIASDVTGRRIQNWIYAFYYFVGNSRETAISPGFLGVFLQSVHEQVSYLRANINPARNHRTLELYAVFLAAVVFPEFADAQDWLDFSRDALADNAAEDILPDGVHCELSSFYHHTALKNFLTAKRLAELNDIALPARLDAAIERALTFSAYIHRPDGFIPALSDADSESFYSLLEQGSRYYDRPDLAYVYSHGQRGNPPAQRSFRFTQSGYYILRSPWRGGSEKFSDARYLVFDCGPLGAGNHGHLDLLNIEVAAYGQPLVVDPGRYSYDESGQTNWRVRFRGTAYHNTVAVDGLNQTRYEYHAGRKKFAITGPAAQALLYDFYDTSMFDYLHGAASSHEYNALHERKICFAAAEYWLICDILNGPEEHDYTLRFHLSEAAQNQVAGFCDGQTRIVDAPHLRVLQSHAQATDFAIESGFVSPRYGYKYPAPVLSYQRRRAVTVFETLLIPYGDEKPQVEVTDIHDSASHSGLQTALHCRIKTSQQTVNDYFFMSHNASPQHWRYGDIECQGHACYLRLDDCGDVLHAFTLPKGELTLGSQPVATEPLRT